MAVGYGDAFAAGVVSIYTPCAGVIVPAFLAYLAGIAVLAPPSGGRLYDLPIVLGSLGFVAGFTAIFVLLGSSLGAASTWTRDSMDLISKGGGIFVVLFGLAATRIVPVPSWGRRGQTALQGTKLVVSFAVGVAFAIGWTPCVNATLGRILTLAQEASSAGEGARLLSVYSGGLMLPFFAVGALGGLAGPRLRMSPWTLRVAAAVTGLALMALGALVFTNRFVELTGYLFSIAR